MGNFYSSNNPEILEDTTQYTYSSKYNWILSYPQKKIIYMTPDNLSQFINKTAHVNEDKTIISNIKKKNYIDLRSMCPDILNDNNLNISTINTICFILHYQLIRNKLDIFPPSRLFIYHNINFFKHVHNIFSFDIIFKAISNYGVCSELSYKYNVDNYNNNNLTNILYNEAEQYKYINIYRIPNSINMLKTMLKNDMIVMIGFIVYNNFHNNDTKINLSDTNTNSIIGGTTGSIVGYIDAQESFIVALSYGKQIGKNGYILIPYKYIENKDLVPELYYIDFDKTRIDSFNFNKKKKHINKTNEHVSKPYGGVFCKN